MAGGGSPAKSQRARDEEAVEPLLQERFYDNTRGSSPSIVPALLEKG